MDSSDEQEEKECDGHLAQHKNRNNNGVLTSEGTDVMLDNFSNNIATSGTVAKCKYPGHETLKIIGNNGKAEYCDDFEHKASDSMTENTVQSCISTCNGGIKIVDEDTDVDVPSIVNMDVPKSELHSKRRRSGVTMCTGTLDLVLDNLTNRRTPVYSDDSSSIGSQGPSFEVSHSRKLSYDADSEAAGSINESGYVNKAFDDHFLDNISLQVQRIIKSVSADNLMPQKEENKEEKKRRISFEEPIKYRSHNGGYHRHLRYEPDGGMETDISEESVAREDDSLASHVRKDSIALWSQRFDDINAFQELYKVQQSRTIKWPKQLSKIKWREYKLHAGVTSMFLVTLILLSVIWHYRQFSGMISATNPKIVFELKSKRIQLTDKNKNDEFVGLLGYSIPTWKLPVHCFPEEETPEKTCLEWRGYAKLEINYFEIKDSSCLNISWESFAPMSYLKDCYDLGSATWYGPANFSGTHWPLVGVNFTFSPSRFKEQNFGSFKSSMDYYWLSSDAVVVKVDQDVPLIVDWNHTAHNFLCLRANFTEGIYNRNGDMTSHLNYTICNGVNMLHTHRNISREYLRKLKQFPEETMFAFPHWSTKWQSGSEVISRDDVINLASQIQDSQLNCSTIELDGQWEHTYGDFSFDKQRFENISYMLDILNGLNCGLSLKIQPYIHYRSENFKYCMKKEYFVKDASGSVPALIEWGSGVGGVLDISNQDAKEWLEEEITKLYKDYGLAAIVFDFGETTWFPYQPKFFNSHLSPSAVHSMYTELASSFDGDVILQAISRGQHLPAFISIPTHVVKADHKTCLSNLITNAFVLGLLGYPFVISDGFLVEEYIKQSSMPSRELYIRWMQVSFFFPAMKFSIAPWSYDVDVVKMAISAQILRSEVKQIIMEMKEEVMQGQPIIRPLWWHNPKDIISQKINDEFFVGESMMVAPVLCESTTKRDIYIPDGIWSDQLRGNLVIGGDWLKNYEVSLYEIPRFRRMDVVGETDKTNAQ